MTKQPKPRQPMKRCQYYKRAIKRHYGGELRGLARAQRIASADCGAPRPAPANRGRRLDAAERQAIEQKMRDEGRL